MTRELIWEIWRGGDLLTCARPTEDGGLIDVDMEDVRIEDGDALALAHPATLGDATKGWVEHMLSFELTQPFDQLSREVFGLEDARAVIEDALRSRALLDPKVLRRLGREGPYTDKPSSSWARHAFSLPMRSRDTLSLFLVASSTQPDAMELDDMKRRFSPMDLPTLDAVTRSECARVLTLARYSP